MLQGEQHHRGSQANARGSLRQGRSQDQRRGHDGEQRVEVQLSEPGCVEAEFLSVHNLLDGFLIARCRILCGCTGELIKESEFHKRPADSNTGLRPEHPHFFDQQRHRPPSMNKVAGIVELLDLQQPERFDPSYSLLTRGAVRALPWRIPAALFFTLFSLAVARETPGCTGNVFRSASPRLDFADAVALWQGRRDHKWNKVMPAVASTNSEQKGGPHGS